MNVPAKTKLAWLDHFIGAYSRRFHVLPMGKHVEALEAAGGLPDKEPDFARTSSAPVPVAG